MQNMLAGETNDQYSAIQSLSSHAICVYEKISQSRTIWQEGLLYNSHESKLFAEFL